MTIDTTAPGLSSLDRVRCGEIMSVGVLTVPPSATVRDVAASMIVHQVHAIVCAEDASPSVLTPLAIVGAALARGLDAHIGAFAGSCPAVEPDAPLSLGARRMHEASNDHVLVIRPSDSAVAGMISGLDVAAVLAGHDPRLLRIAGPAPARPALSVNRLGRVRVRDVMHEGVHACPPSASPADVADLLARRRVHCVGVQGDAGEPAWLLSTGDLLAALAAGRLDARAGELADTERHGIAADQTVEAAGRLMIARDVSHLLVLEAGAAVGVVSALDVAGVLSVR